MTDNNQFENNITPNNNQSPENLQGSQPTSSDGTAPQQTGYSSFYNNTSSTPPPAAPANQTTSWSFPEYGPIGGSGAPDPKKPQKGNGIRILAVIMSVLFFVTVATFAGYIIWNENQPLGNDSASSQPSNNNGGGASLDIDSIPDRDGQDVDPVTGKMTTPAIYQQVNPSVVGIITYVRASGYQVSGQGSGVIISKDGYIVTNAHVIESSDPRFPVAKIEVVLDNKQTYEAKLLGADTKSDLAVLKIEEDNLTPASFGDSDDLVVGEYVVAIGNPDGQTFAGSLTDGIISAVNREIYYSDSGETMSYLQTNAAINPGNSGGALVNEYGQVVGIITAKVSATGYEGLGFAIPSNTAKPIVDSIIENGYVKGRVKIGISYRQITPTLAQLNGLPVGLRIFGLEDGFDVAKKLQLGDIITHMEGKEVTDQASITAALEGKVPGDTLSLTVYRVDESGRANTLSIDIILGEDTPSTAAE